MCVKISPALKQKYVSLYERFLIPSTIGLGGVFQNCKSWYNFTFWYILNAEGTAVVLSRLIWYDLKYLRFKKIFVGYTIKILHKTITVI